MFTGSRTLGRLLTTANTNSRIKINYVCVGCKNIAIAFMKVVLTFVSANVVSLYKF